MRVLLGLLAVGWGCQLSACRDGSNPEFSPIADQVVRVGDEVRVDLLATDPDGDQLTYSFGAIGPSESTPLTSRAQLSQTARGGAVFRFTPTASDVGTWYLDFAASDGEGRSTATMQLDVRSAVGGAAAPIFRRPLGSGATLDLSEASCLDVELVVEDQDNASVELRVEPAAFEGALLEQTSGLAGVWTWCPTPSQIATQPRHEVTLIADDGDNPPTRKPFLLVLHKDGRTDCPGAPPTIVHDPSDVASQLDIVLTAMITDDVGLKRAPLLYFSSDNNAPLSDMTQVTMQPNGAVWSARLPNPVANQPGASAQLFYRFFADDDDDTMGDCDHAVVSPASGNYAMTVTNDGTGLAPICAACSADTQCGGAGLCIYLPADVGTSCLTICEGDADCNFDELCSSVVSSIDGAQGRVCLPVSGACHQSPACADDAWEENDAIGSAVSVSLAEASDVQAVLCAPEGADDEDWFELTVGTEGTLSVVLAGDAAVDLDLEVYDGLGQRRLASTSFASDETVSGCFAAGTFYVRILGWGTGRSAYDVRVSHAPLACALTCTDDAFEDDDLPNQARIVGLSYSQANNQLCPGDRDLYSLVMFAAETVTANLSFSQLSSSQDLDVHFLDIGGNDLTPCSPEEPSTCDAQNGQSADPNETFMFTAPTTCSPCRYYLSVQGYGEASNQYGIAIQIQ